MDQILIQNTLKPGPYNTILVQTVKNGQKWVKYNIPDPPTNEEDATITVNIRATSP